jgi:hypothetical protein
VEQIDERAKAWLALLRADGRRLICAPGRFPFGPTSWDKRAAAVGQDQEQHLNATATHGTHDLQNATLKGMPLADDSYRT